MIIDVLLDLLFGLLTLIAGLLPDVSIAAFQESWGQVVDNLGALNYYLPIGELFAVVIAVFLLWPSMLVASLVAWLIALFRGGSANG